MIQRYLRLFSFFAFILFIFSCKKEKLGTERAVFIESINGTYEGDVDYEARIENLNVDDIQRLGICWSKSNEIPTVDDEINTSSLASGKFIFKDNLKGFEYSSTYYFRAFVQQKNQNIYYSDVKKINFLAGWRLEGIPNPGISLERFYFTTPLIGYIIGSGASEMDYLYKTTDGGKTMTGSAFPEGNSTYDLVFVTDEKGFRVSFTDSEYILQRTLDGGSTWTSLNYGVGYRVVAISSTDPNTIYIATENNYIKKSTNSGGFWYSSVQLELHETDKIVDLEFLDMSTGFALTKNGNLYKTVDAGISWNLTTPLIANLSKEIIFLNTYEWIIITNQSIYKSYDSGATWNLKYKMSHVNDIIRDVDFANDKVGAVSGNRYSLDGFVLITRDGGESWGEYKTFPFVALNIQMFGPDSGILCAHALYRYF